MGGPPGRAATAPEWAWVRQEGGPSDEGASQLAPDGHGNIYLLGAFGTVTSIGSNTLTNSAVGAFLAKYDSRGKLLWVFSPAGPGSWGTGDSAIHVDALGGAYVAGTIDGELDFGGHKLASVRREVAVVKFDPRGRVVWAVQADVLCVEDAGFVSALDNRGDFLLGGWFQGEIRVGPIVLTSGQNDDDSYFVKLDRHGRLVWARQSGNPRVDGPNALAVNANGNLYVAGTMIIAAEPGPGEVGSQPVYRTFFSQYDRHGNELWTICAEPSLGSSQARKIVVDQAGNAYAAGQFTGTLVLGGLRVEREAAGREGSFLAKIDRYGEVAWLRTLGSTEFDTIAEIAADDAGNLHAAGQFLGRTSIGTQRLNSGAYMQAFVAKYDRHGRPLWGHQLESSSFSQFLGLRLDTFGRAHLLGERIAVSGSAARPAMVSGEEYTHLCVASYARDGRRLWVEDLDSDTLHMWSIFTVDILGDCYLAGSFEETLAFGSTELISRGSRDLFLARLSPGTPAGHARFQLSQ